MAEANGSPLKIDVLLAGTLWDSQMQADCIGVTVTDRLNAADECLLHLESEDNRYHGHESLAAGTPIEVRLGWGSEVQAVFYGEIVGTQTMFPREGPPTIEVKAFDRLFRLMRKKQERTLLDMTDSDVAQKIAQEHGLQADVDATSVKHAYLLQSGQSDWDFITQRAMASGRVVRVENKTLTFKDASVRPEPVRTLTLEADLPGISLTTSIEGMPSGMTVMGWDDSSKKKIEGKVTLSDVKPELKMTKLGADISKTVMGDAEWLVQDAPVSSPGEAEELAKSLLREAVAPFVTGTIQVTGDAALRAGAVVELTGLGKRLSGRYAIDTSHHRCDDRGYTTKCELVCNGWIPPPPGAPKEEAVEPETIDIDVTVVDSLGSPMANTPYVITLVDGSVRQGQTDGDGHIAETGCPKGPYKIDLDEYILSVSEKA